MQQGFHRICRVAFGADPNKPYSYFAGDLNPAPGDLVVVPVGKDNSLKIVTCIDVIEEPIELTRAVKLISGVVVKQGEAARLK